MDTVWIEFLSRLEGILPGSTSGFAPATKNEVNSFESALGSSLPADFKRYLELAGGRKAGHKLPCFQLLSLYSLDEIKADRLQLLDVFGDEPPISHIRENKLKPYIWRPLWIPFMDFNAVHRIFIDLDPGKNGRFGQIVRDYPGIDIELDSIVISQSFEDFIRDFTRRLAPSTCQVENGNITFNTWP